MVVYLTKTLSGGQSGTVQKLVTGVVNAAIINIKGKETSFSISNDFVN